MVPRARTYGVVRYLNARPLTAALEHDPQIRVVADVPARLVEQFRAGALDVALLPVMAYLGGLGDALVPGLCIGARGQTGSVRLFCQRPRQEIRHVQLDAESVTSNALCRVLMHQAWGLSPEWRAPGAGATDADAVVRIGDKAMQPAADVAETIDLGEAWWQWCGLPFVFAAWVVRAGVDDPGLSERLAAALTTGLGRLPELAAQGAPATGLPAAECEQYLRERIHYRLGPEEIAGLRHFAAAVHREGLTSAARELRWYPA